MARLLVLPLSFVRRTSTWDIIVDFVPGAVARSLVLAAGVAIGTLLIGGSLAVLVAFYEFPGRRFVEWAVVLPLGMPAYILTFVILGQYDGSSALKSAASAVGMKQLPEIRSPAGAILMLTLRALPLRLPARPARRFSNSRLGLMEVGAHARPVACGGGATSCAAVGAAGVGGRRCRSR